MGYYKSQFENVVSQNPVETLKFQIVGDNTKTNFLNLNKESAAELQKFCASFIKPKKFLACEDLLAFINQREYASWENSENLGEFDSTQKEEAAILDTLELMRRFIQDYQ